MHSVHCISTAHFHSSCYNTMEPSKTPTCTAQGSLAQDWSQQVADALSLMVEQCPQAIEEQEDLCRLLQTSTAIRAALQRSRGSFHISIGVEVVPGFAAWLPGHAGLVRELYVRDGKRTPREEVLNQALSVAPTLAAALRTAATVGPSQCPPLQLVKYYSSCLTAAEVLVALPTSLTRLDFGGWTFSLLNTSMAGLGAALAQLPSLQSLHLPWMDDKCDAVPAWLPPLTRLTQLAGATFSSFEDVALPASLRQLRARVIDATGNADINFDMRRFSGLQYVEIECDVNDFPGDIAWEFMHTTITLPSHLTGLHLRGPFHDVLGLEQQGDLQLFRLERSDLDMSRIIQILRGLPPLTDVRLAGDVPGDEQVLAVDAQRLLDVVASAGSKLTALHFVGFDLATAQQGAPLDVVGLEPPRPGVVWNQQLQQLSKLQSLDLSLSFAAPVDAMGLSALTGLTELCLRRAGPGVDDVVVVALCANLTGLQGLEIQQASLSRASAVFAAVGGMSGLKHLWLIKMDALVVTDADLVLLHSLRGLDSACLPRQLKHQCSAEALSALFAALTSPSQKRRFGLEYAHYM